MYTATLAIHSILRWAVLVIALVAIVAHVRAWTGALPWTPRHARLGRLLVIAMDVQVLLGLLLYLGLSPVTHAAFGHFGAAMGDRVSRFWAVEHSSLMLLAVILVHAGAVLARKAAEPVAKHRRSAVAFALALVAVLVAIPWPGTAVGRALLPGF